MFCRDKRLLCDKTFVATKMILVAVSPMIINWLHQRLGKEDEKETQCLFERKRNWTKLDTEASPAQLDKTRHRIYHRYKNPKGKPPKGKPKRKPIKTGTEEF